MNNQTQLNAPQHDNEISLREIVILLKEGWRWSLGGLCLGIAFAVIYLSYEPKYFDVIAIVQPAMVGADSSFKEPVLKGVEVEPIPQTLERLASATFYTDDLLKACQASSWAQIRGNLVATQVKGVALVQFRYRDFSGDVAHSCLNAILDKLVKTQANIAAPLIEVIEQGIQSTQKQMDQVARYQAQLENNTITRADTASLLMLNSLAQREELVKLQKLMFDQKVKLLVLTRPMQLLEPIYVPQFAAEPKKFPILAGGLLGGLVLGGLVFFVRCRWLTQRI